jgi:acyl transferase domain-containing protein
MTAEFPQRISRLSPLKLALAAQRVAPELDLIKAEPIAVIGLGCRLPGADSPEAYWQLLKEGGDAISEVPPERWNLEQYYDPDENAAGKMYTRYGGFLARVDEFDPAFFGISPREVHSLDPQQRLLMEVAWEALERANQVPEQLYNSATGVFIGICTSDYAKRLLQGNDPTQIDAYYGTGNALSVAAGRLSYALGLTGPCLAVDTACSSSLVSVHLACQSLRQRECHLALAGGVNLILSPENTITFSRARMMSPDGRCKTFDATANGYVRGEGCGLVVLKRLADAIADGDAILALVRGSAVNQDGPSGGLTVPNGPSQQAVIRQALASGGVTPEQVSYVEAHGTGTALGDPIEVGALGAVFGADHTPENPLWIGSAKTNIGHLEGAAGIAGFIKVVLALQHGEIPPHLHFQQPSPHIPWDRLPVKVPTQLRPWPEQGDRRVAGVSSFGFSGTNAHVVLEAAPDLSSGGQQVLREKMPPRPGHVFTLSAKTELALRQMARQYADFITGNPDLRLADLCFTANTCRTHFSHRLAVVAETSDKVLDALTTFSTQQPSARVTWARVDQPPRVVFLFTGQGSQYGGMARQLYETQPRFRETLDQCDALLQPYLGDSLLSVIYAAPTDSRLHQTQYTQPALFALEYALAKLWQSWGVKPAAVLGHSVGEYVAACIAGVFSLEAGLQLMARRGKLMQALPLNGGMAAVLAGVTTVERVIEPYGERVAIATLNGPQNTVISGLTEDLKQILDSLATQGIEAKLLKVSHAFHSPLMDPILQPLAQQINQLNPQVPHIPFVSNVTGRFLTPGETLDGDYWQRHTRQTVRFADGLTALQQSGYTLFLEIGPQPVLSSMGQQCLTADNLTWLPSLKRGQDDWTTLLKSLATLYVQGVAIDWASFDQPYGYRRLPLLPTYPFQRQRYWVDLVTPKLLSPVTTSDRLAPGNEEQNGCYTVTWQLQPPSFKLSEPVAKRQSWLLFGSAIGQETPLEKELIEQLKQHGCLIVQVSAGDSFAALSVDHYQINPTSAEDFRQLFKALSGSLTLEGILYHWSQPVPDPEGALEPFSPGICQSVLLLIQALPTQPWSQWPKLWLLTQGAHAVEPAESALRVEQTLIWGLGRVLRYEHPELWGGLIDLDNSLASEATLAAQASVLIAHLQAADREDEIALRGGQRYVARLTPQPLPKVASSLTLQPDATYLITGGLGALGLRVAQWLVSQGARHLVLVSRRPNDQHPLLTQWRQAGVEVQVEALDVAQAEAVQDLIARIQAQGYELKGIIHAAGILDDGILVNQTWSRFEQVLRPKVLGAWHLHQATQECSLDFFPVVFFNGRPVGGSGAGELCRRQCLFRWPGPPSPCPGIACPKY